MKILFKIIFFISLIINVLNACSGKSNSECNSDDDCTWDEGSAATCTAIDDIMATECTAANTNAGTCAAVKTTANTELCSFDDPACTVKTTVIEGLCTAAVADKDTCEGVLKETTKLCTFTAAVDGSCKDIARASFTGAITIKLKSVKGKTVVITLEPAEADKNLKVTAETTIKNLQLNSGSSFTKDLTCKIAKGSKLGDVDCTMDTAATKDTKYKLIAKSDSQVSFDGKDTFTGAITVNDAEVTATEETSPSGSPDNNSSSYMKISSFFIFLFLLF